jgi:lipoate-protein ligase A
MKTNSITRKFGKLLRIDIAYNTTITDLKITGDFFMHPEETLEQIVSALIGTEVPIQKEEIRRKINYVCHNNETEIIGLTIDDIVNTIIEATQ